MRGLLEKKKDYKAARPGGAGPRPETKTSETQVELVRQPVEQQTAAPLPQPPMWAAYSAIPSPWIMPPFGGYYPPQPSWGQHRH